MPDAPRKILKKLPSGDAEEVLPWYKRSAVIVALIGALVGLTGTFVKVVLPKISGGSSNTTAFRGRVSDSRGGRSIARAKVALEGKGLPPLIYTDSEGVFTFDLPDDAKEIKVRVEASGYDVYERRVDVSAKKELEDIPLTPQAEAEKSVGLSGSVVDQNEGPLQGAKVTLDDVRGMIPVETSSDGVFNVENLPLKVGDRVRLRVVLEGYTPNPYLKDVVLGDYPPTAHLTKKR
jgi:hypothetical protein